LDCSVLLRSRPALHRPAGLLFFVSAFSVNLRSWFASRVRMPLAPPSRQSVESKNKAVQLRLGRRGEDQCELRFMQESAQQTDKARKCSCQICGSTPPGADGRCLRSTLIAACREPKSLGPN